MTMFPAGAPIMTAAGMRDAEDACFASGISQDALMERAGAAVAREVLRFAIGRPVLVLAGPGNNGGDAYVVARHLLSAGLDVTVAALGEPKAGSAAAMRRLWTGDTVPIARAEGRPVLVDGLFGTGMSRPLDPEASRILQVLVDHADFSLAIDLPSGIATDTGESLGAPRGIDATVALGALKPAHCLADGLERCGHVLLADIGVAVPDVWRTVTRPRLSAPPAGAHKYSRGLVLVVEGSMPGAAHLAARAALSAGAGYVTLAGTDEVERLPDAIVRRRVEGAAELATLLEDERIGSVVIGPGLGRDDRAAALLGAALASPHRLVLDGDALALLELEALRKRTAPAWLTPHGGEFTRLFGRSADKIRATLDAAASAGATVVHKGADTVVADKDGSLRVAAHGSSWLSTAGTGDVLAGILGARVAAGAPQAAEEAVWLHSRAARLAGPAFIADDLIPQLGSAIAECL